MSLSNRNDLLPEEPGVGLWDQWCVLNDRPYSKEGDRSLMDEAACRMFLENFRRSPDDLPCNISHDKAQVVGFYNAMALFVGGVCVDLASHDPAVLAPTLAELPGADNGAPPDDGIYWRRRELTELGLAASTYLRKVSPEFFMRGKNQHEEEVGPLAVGGAWTNYPFLPGCEKHAFERTTTMPKPKTFAARAYEEAGVKDDDPAKFSKLRSFWKGKHGEEYAKLEEEGGVEKDDDDEKAMGKMTIFMAGRFGKEGAAADGGQQMTGPSVSAGAPAEVNGGEANKDPVAGPTSMERGAAFQQFARELGLPADPAAARAKLQTYQAAAAALPQLNQQVQELAAERTERAKDRQKVEAQEFTREAWRKGQIRPRQNETHAQAQGRILQLYTSAGKGAAEAALNDPGSYTPPEAVAGALQLFSNERPAQEASRPDEEILRRCAVEMEKDGIEDPAGKKRGGVWDYRLGKYAKAICQQDPQLAKRYAGQSRMALLEGLA